MPFDVLVVGAGAAGLYAALCLPESCRVGLISKDRLSLSASDWAQGGMAAAIAPDDSPLLHIEDTLRAGAGLCEIEAVQFLAEKARECVESLVELGVGFDRSPDAGLALTLEAAHSRRRVLHASDTTGRAVVSALTAKVLNRENIQVLSPGFVLSLWLAPAEATEQPEDAEGDKGEDPGAKDLANMPRQSKTRCQGVCLVYQNKITWLPARAVVVATGGGGQVFAQTTNPPVSTGDGVAMAWRAGAIVRDLEFVQFHPTALSKTGAPRFLISEAVRGEGAHLVDSSGYRFAFDYHPKGELAPRDTVSRAIFQHLQNSGADPAEANVWLDMRPISPEKIRERFPNIIRVCRQWGIDVFTEPVPVAPAAHYWMGGIATDLTCATSIAGLYAIGETASTGVHGANRLASNSLLECIVFGAQLASSTLTGEATDSDSLLKEQEQEREEQPEKNPISGVSTKERLSNFSQKQDWPAQQAKLEAIRQELPRLVWQSAGIYRGRAALEEAIERVQVWQAEFAALPLSQKLLNLTPGQSLAEADLSELLPEPEKQLRFWGETGNLLDVAYLILTSAAFRVESRGGHYRSDFPQAEPNWRVHTLVQNNIWSKSAAIG
ncbi:MAG: L-aspartate oxidase [Oscillatoria sp. SIO1A7]|nr:L-aspartate oxidase [Oscillatoria sp. SIO1A7]